MGEREHERPHQGFSEEDFLRAYTEVHGSTPPVEPTRETPRQRSAPADNWANAPLWGNDEDIPVPPWVNNKTRDSAGQSEPSHDDTSSVRTTSPPAFSQQPPTRHGYQSQPHQDMQADTGPGTTRLLMQRVGSMLPGESARKMFALTRRHKWRTAGSLALVATAATFTFRGGAAADVMPDISSSKSTTDTSAEPVADEHYTWPSLDCLDPAFSANIISRMQMLTRVTVIDGADQAAVAKARQQAYKDPKYRIPKDLQTRGIFTDDAETVYAWPLPTTDAFTAAENGEKIDPKTAPYENRIPLAQIGGPGQEMDFGVCLNDGATMSEAVIQKSPYHLVVDDSKLKIPALQNPQLTKDYEIARPQPPTYPAGTKDSDKQWLFNEYESRRILQRFAPDGKYSKDNKSFSAGKGRNQTALDLLKLATLQYISNDPVDSAAIQKAMCASVDAKLKAAVNAADGTNVVIDHYNSPTMPGEYFASVIRVTEDNVGNQDFAFINPDVQFSIANQDNSGGKS